MNLDEASCCGPLRPVRTVRPVRCFCGPLFQVSTNMAEDVFTVGDYVNLPMPMPMPALTQSESCCDNHSHEHKSVKIPSIFDAVKSGFVVVKDCNVV